jgi:hypothetical protein
MSFAANLAFNTDARSQQIFSKPEEVSRSFGLGSALGAQAAVDGLQVEALRIVAAQLPQIRGIVS